MRIKIINLCTVLLVINAVYAVYVKDGNCYLYLIIAYLNNITSILLEIKDKLKNL